MVHFVCELKEELVTVLGEIRRVLKPGGRLIIHTAPNKQWLELGYKYFTRYTNYVASKLVWEIAFNTKLQYGKDPRSKSDKKVHVNEQTLKSLKRNLEKSGALHL